MSIFEMTASDARRLSNLHFQSPQFTTLGKVLKAIKKESEKGRDRLSVSSSVMPFYVQKELKNRGFAITPHNNGEKYIINW